MIARLTASKQWRFFGVLLAADRPLALLWWAALVLRGVLPAIFSIAMGVLVAAVQRGGSLAGPLTTVGVTFVVLQMLAPVHRTAGYNLGNRTAAWLYDQLTIACVRPPGMGHLEDPNFTSDLTMARDFDLAIMGPPMSVSMDFISGGLVELVSGLSGAILLAGYTWWAPLLLGGAWAATHWLLREAAFWKDRETSQVREAQRHADYAYRLAVDAPSAKELRLFGLSKWTVERFSSRRKLLLDLQWQATRLKQRPVFWSMLLVLTANILVFALLASDAASGALPLGRVVTFMSAAANTS